MPTGESPLVLGCAEFRELSSMASPARRECIMIDSENPGSNEAESSAEQQPSIEPFTFHGNGADYFRIWIVNMLFTILTLGIYSAWAKVRSKRYFYGNTELAGDRFEYLANPVAILKGRLIAVAALLAYSLSGLISFQASLIAFALLILLFPLIVVQSLRFNTSNSAWRGVRFGFDGSAVEAYDPYLLWPFLGAISLGLCVPYYWFKSNRFQFNNFRFGTTNSTFSATAKGFYGIGLAVLVTSILAIVLIVILIFVTRSFLQMIGSEALLENAELMSLLSLAPTYLVVYVFVVSIYQALYYRLVFNSLEIGGSRLQNSISIEYIGVILVNTILIIVTLGFFYPWAAVRRTRYLLSNMRLEARELDSFTAGEHDHISAQGDEFGEAFDLGIGF